MPIVADGQHVPIIMNSSSIEPAAESGKPDEQLTGNNTVAAQTNHQEQLSVPDKSHASSVKSGEVIDSSPVINNKSNEITFSTITENNTNILFSVDNAESNKLAKNSNDNGQITGSTADTSKHSVAAPAAVITVTATSNIDDIDTYNNEPFIHSPKKSNSSSNMQSPGSSGKKSGRGRKKSVGIDDMNRENDLPHSSSTEDINDLSQGKFNNNSSSYKSAILLNSSEDTVKEKDSLNDELPISSISSSRQSSFIRSKRKLNDISIDANASSHADKYDQEEDNGDDIDSPRKASHHQVVTPTSVVSNSKYTERENDEEDPFVNARRASIRIRKNLTPLTVSTQNSIGNSNSSSTVSEQESITPSSISKDNLRRSKRTKVE
jgi:hypothetical protein